MNSLSYGGPEVAPRERSVPRCPLRTFPRDCFVRQIIYGGAYVTGTQQLGGSGGKFLEFRGYEVASETIFGQNNASRPEARRQSFTCMNINPFCTLRLSDRSLISQATPFADRLEERKIVGTLGLSHCSQPSRIMLQHVTTLCAYHGRLPSIGPIWRRQASHG